MAATLESQLTSVQAAIAKLEAGAQSVSVDGVSITKPDLNSLYKRELSLLRRIASAARGATGVGRRVCEF